MPPASTAAAKSGPKKRAADVVEKVYREVKKLAVECRFRPGERVNEVELAQRFNVSRTPVRQALSRLAHEEFVTFVPNRGFYAREITPEDVKQIYELRALIEHGAYGLACLRATDAQVAEIAADWSVQVGGDQDFEALADADERFHVGIARLAGNPHIVSALVDVNAKLRYFRRIDLENAARRGSTFDEHAAALEHLARRDPAGADILRDHIVMSSDHAVEVTKEGLARIFFGAAKERSA